MPIFENQYQAQMNQEERFHFGLIHEGLTLKKCVWRDLECVKKREIVRKNVIWFKLIDFSKNEELTYWNTDSNSIENGLSADYRLQNAVNLGVYQTIESYNFYNDIHAY